MNSGVWNAFSFISFCKPWRKVCWCFWGTIIVWNIFSRWFCLNCICRIQHFAYLDFCLQKLLVTASDVCRHVLLWKPLWTRPLSYLKYSTWRIWVAVIFLLSWISMCACAHKSNVDFFCPPSAELWKIIVLFLCCKIV